MSERPLHDFIDMEAYDVVSGERHRALVAQFERELIAARIDKARLEEQFEALRDALRNLYERPTDPSALAFARIALRDATERAHS